MTLQLLSDELNTRKNTKVRTFTIFMEYGGVERENGATLHYQIRFNSVEHNPMCLEGKNQIYIFLLSDINYLTFQHLPPILYSLPGSPPQYK